MLHLIFRIDEIKVERYYDKESGYDEWIAPKRL